MGKCLITKLMGVVSNDNLLRLNESRFSLVNKDSGEQTVSFTLTQDAIIESSTEVTVNNSKTVKTNVFAGTITIKIPAKTEAIISIIATKRSIGTIWFTNTKLEFNTGNIEGKTSINEIRVESSSNVIVDIDSQALSNTTIISAGYQNVKGKLGNLSPTITEFVADGDKNVCTGNLSDIQSTVLTKIVVDYAPYLRGSIESFVENQVKLGRTSGTVLFRAAYTYLKYNNIYFSTVSIKFDSDNVTVSGSNVKTGTFNKTENT